MKPLDFTEVGLNPGSQRDRHMMRWYESDGYSAMMLVLSDERASF